MGVLGILCSGCVSKGNDILDTEIKIDNNIVQNEINVPEEQVEILEETTKEEVIESIDVGEEKPSKRKVSVKDAKKFLKEKKLSETVEVSAESVEKVEEVVEVDVESNGTTTSDIESAHKASESSLTGAGYYDAAKDFYKDDFASYPISCTDLASNSTLLALQAEVNPIIDNDGGCNEGFILRSNEAIISYVGESYFVDAKILVDGNLQTTVSINCHLNDVSWRCISTTLEEIYPNLGASLSAEMRKACEVGSELYGNFNTWNTYNGIHTKVILAENGDSLVFVLR